MPRRSSSASSTTRPLRDVPLKTAALSVRREAGHPNSWAAPRKGSRALAALTGGKATEATNRREWSSMKLRISTRAPSARCQSVASACQRSFGETGLEADEGGAGALVRLWRDQAMTAEDPPDGAAGGRWRSHAPGEVVQDRLRSAVVPGGKEVAPQLEDGGDHRLADRPGGGSGSACLRGQRFVASAPDPGDQPIEPAPRDAVGPGDVGRAAFLDE